MTAANTDLDIHAIPLLKALDFEVIKIYRDWWYTSALLEHRQTKRRIMASTRTMRSGITIVPDPNPEIINKLDSYPEDAAEINEILCDFRNQGFDHHWSYQSQTKMEDWLKQQKIVPWPN